MLDQEMDRLMNDLTDTQTIEVRSRMIVERLALTLQAAILVRAGNAIVSDAFCASRLGGEHGQAFGTLSASAPLQPLIERAFPSA